MAGLNDPSTEPNNPDGCKELKKASSAIADFTAIFVRASQLIESSAKLIAQSFKSTVKSRVSGTKSKGMSDAEKAREEEYRIEQIYYANNVDIIKNQQKAAEREIKDRLIAIRAVRGLQKLNKKKEKSETEEKLIAIRAIRGLRALNRKKDNAEKQLNNRKIKAESDAAKKVENDKKKAADKESNDILIGVRAMRGLRSLNNRKIKAESDAAKKIEKENKKLADDKLAATKQEEKNRLIEIRAMRGLRALNKRKNAVEKNEQRKKENETKSLQEKRNAALNDAKKRFPRIFKAVDFARMFGNTAISAGKKIMSAGKIFGQTIFESFSEAKNAFNKERDRQKKKKQAGDSIRNAVDAFLNRSLFATAKAQQKKNEKEKEQKPIREAVKDFTARNRLRTSAGIPGQGVREKQGNAVKMVGFGGKKKPQVERFAKGGKAQKKGTDTVPAMLTPGEFVVSKKAAEENKDELQAMNQGRKRYALGGIVAAAGRGLAAGARGAARGATRGGAAPAGGAAPPAPAGGDVPGPMDGIMNAVAPLGMAFTTLKTAVLGPVDMFNQLVGFAGKFVQAVNPALMQQLNLAFQDLYAVIGGALQPVIMAATTIIRGFADRLQPVMQAMAPIIDQFAQKMIELSGPVITILLEGFAALEPILGLIMAAMENWTNMLVASMPMITGVIKTLVYAFTQVVSSFMYGIGKIVNLIPGTGDLGKKMMESADAAKTTADNYYAGTTQVQKALKEPVKKGASTGAAAKSASFSGISDLGKNIMQAAFSSGTQAAQVKTAEYSEKMYGVLDEMNKKMGGNQPMNAGAAGVRRGAV